MEVKNQHYIPRFYLKHFSKANQINVFDKVERRIFPINIEKAARENYFYDLPMGRYKNIKEKQVIEKILSTMENVFAPLFKRLRLQLLMGSFQGFNDTIVMQIAHFIVLQSLRSREARELLVQLDSEYCNISTRHHPKYRDKEINVRITKDDEPFYHGKHLINISNHESIRNILQDFIWTVLENPTSMPLMISDNPIVRFPHERKMILAGSSIGYGIEIVFPFTHRHLIVALEPDYFEKKTKYFRLKKRLLTFDNVRFYNYLQALESYRYIFSIENDFQSIIAAIENDPIISDLSRKRFKHEQLDIATENPVYRVWSACNYEKCLGNSFFSLPNL